MLDAFLPLKSLMLQNTLVKIFLVVVTADKDEWIEIGNCVIDKALPYCRNIPLIETS